MDDTIFWQSDPSPVRENLSSTHQISAPRSFPTSVSHPLSDFHPWWHRFRFHSLKTKPENREGDDEGARERDGAGREAHKQTDNWVWGCHSRLLAHTLSFFFFSASSFTALYILFGEKSWTSFCTVVCWSEEQHSVQTSELTENCQKSLSPVKTTQHIHSKPEHKTELFVFPESRHSLNSLQMITQAQESFCNGHPCTVYV